MSPNLRFCACSWVTILHFCRCNTESEWYQIHDNIIRKVSSRYSQVGSGTGQSCPYHISHVYGKTISIYPNMPNQFNQLLHLNTFSLYWIEIPSNSLFCFLLVQEHYLTLLCFTLITVQHSFKCKPRMLFQQWGIKNEKNMRIEQGCVGSEL